MNVNTNCKPLNFKAFVLPKGGAAAAAMSKIAGEKPDELRELIKEQQRIPEYEITFTNSTHRRDFFVNYLDNESILKRDDDTELLLQVLNRANNEIKARVAYDKICSEFENNEK